MDQETYEAVPQYRRQFVKTTVKASNDDKREIVHLISTAAVDRAGDIVEPGGVQLDNFLQNPVVLVDHDYRTEKIIGKAASLGIEEDGIWARTTFRDTPLAQDAFKLAKEGLGGWSIGFRPIEHETIRDDKGAFKGFRFKTWELLEYSAVAIPMNQEIVNNAIQRGLVDPDRVSTFFRVQSQPSTEAPPAANVEHEAADYPGLKTAIDAALGTFERADAARRVNEVTRKD